MVLPESCAVKRAAIATGPLSSRSGVERRKGTASSSVWMGLATVPMGARLLRYLLQVHKIENRSGREMNIPACSSSLCCTLRVVAFVQCWLLKVLAGGWWQRQAQQKNVDLGSRVWYVASRGKRRDERRYDRLPFPQESYPVLSRCSQGLTHPKGQASFA